MGTNVELFMQAGRFYSYLAESRLLLSSQILNSKFNEVRQWIRCSCGARVRRFWFQSPGGSKLNFAQ